MTKCTNEIYRNRNMKNKGNQRDVKLFNKKKKLSSTDGKVKERCEVSIYFDELKTFDTYLNII